MPITLPLQTMSVEEKMQVMESIWVDLCSTAGSTLTPNWHADVLASRSASFLAEKDEILDWGSAKKKIYEDIR
jgi:hypothetical protein